jgi:hypothetical protein
LAAWLSDREIACSPEDIRAALMIWWRRVPSQLFKCWGRPEWRPSLAEYAAGGLR